MNGRNRLRNVDMAEVRSMSRPKFAETEKAARATYERRERAIELYFEGQTLGEIKRETRICKQEIYRFVARFNTLRDDGGIVGFFALVPGAQVVRIRHAASDKLSRKTAVSGAFGLLLRRYPEVQRALQNLALYGNEEGIRREGERGLKMIVLHERFIRNCLEAGIAAPRYPFNSASEGLPALTRWVRELRRHRYSVFLSNEDPEAARQSKPSPGTLKTSWRARRCFDRVECDGTHLDIELIVTLPSPDEEGIVRRRFHRIWLIVLIEVVSRSVLGYSCALGGNYSWTDVFSAVRSAYLPWKPKEVGTLSRLYSPGDALPQGYDGRLHGVLFDELYLDRHLAHRAEAFLTVLQSKLGCVPVFGPAHSPNVRPHVENLIHLLDEAGIHRMPATLGSSPHDIRRDRSCSPLAYHLDFETIEALIDILICKYNNSRSPMSTVSCNEVLLQSVARGRHLVRRVPQGELGGLFDIVHIGHSAASRSKGQHGQVIVRALDDEYSSTAFGSRHDLVGQDVTWFAGQDVRQIEAFLSDGTGIGMLSASPRFMGQAHGLLTRRCIKAASVLDSVLRNCDDAVRTYRSIVADKARSQKKAVREYERLRQEQRDLTGSRVQTEEEVASLQNTWPAQQRPVEQSEGRWAGDMLADALLRNVMDDGQA